MPNKFFRVGSFATDTITDIIPLHARTNVSGNVATFRKMGVGSGYQVTAGKTLYIVHMEVYHAIIAATYANFLALGYADNDVGIDTATARTNPVALVGNPEGTVFADMGMVWYAASPNQVTPSAPQAMVNITIPVPAGKYIYMKTIDNGLPGMKIVAWGFEV